MRELKFRALNAQAMFVYGTLIPRNYDGNKQLYIYDTRADETEINEYAGGAGGKWDLKDCFTPVQLGTEGQYIGLKDKNGVEIYEWDLLRYSNEERVYTVSWSSEGGFIMSSTASDAENERFMIGIYNIKDMEVIGNIYENPELLESIRREV